jgi:hypothetical protein
VVALDAEGRPSFNLLQNSAAGAPRRELIEEHILPELADPIRYSPLLEGSLKNLIDSV